MVNKIKKVSGHCARIMLFAAMLLTVAAGAAQPASATGGPCRSTVVCLYQHHHFGGRYIAYQPTYVGECQTLHTFNDIASSLHNNSNFLISFHEHASCIGSTITLGKTYIWDLSSTTMNDKISSFKVVSRL